MVLGLYVAVVEQCQETSLVELLVGREGDDERFLMSQLHKSQQDPPKV
jgi:hypothetical protein